MARATLISIGKMRPLNSDLYVGPKSETNPENSAAITTTLDGENSHKFFYQVYEADSKTSVIATYDLKYVLEAGIGERKPFHYRKAPGGIANGAPLPSGITDNMKFSFEKFGYGKDINYRIVSKGQSTSSKKLLMYTPSASPEDLNVKGKEIVTGPADFTFRERFFLDEYPSAVQVEDDKVVC